MLLGRGELRGVEGVGERERGGGVEGSRGKRVEGEYGKVKGVEEERGVKGWRKRGVSKGEVGAK